MTDARQPDCLLINASGAAYTILPNEPWQPPGPGNPNARFYNNVGWSNTPSPVVAGGLQTDAALVGTAPAVIDSATQEATVVAFRGTLSPGGGAANWPIIYDWLINDVLTSFPVPTSEFGADAKVHEGFWNATNDLWDGVIAAVRAADGGAGRPLLITGHSKGGPLATLTAAKIAAAHAAGELTDVPVPTVVTFASPHPGNSGFAGYYNAAVTQRRWEFALDIVPLVPPTPEVANAIGDLVKKVPELGEFLGKLFDVDAAWDWTPVGELMYVNSRGNYTWISLSELHRLEVDILPEILRYGTATLGAAHCHGCPDDFGTVCDGGYMTGACADTCCT